MATTTLLLHSSHHHHHHEPHKRQPEEETSSCDGSDVSSRHPPSPPRPNSSPDSFSHQNNDHLSVTRGDDRRSSVSALPTRLSRASCSDEDDCCSNNDDEDELLSVGSESPPPILPITDHLVPLTSSSTPLNPAHEDDDEDSDAKTDMGSTSQSSDSCSRSSISRCSLMTDCYSTSSSITSPLPPAINPAKFVPSSPEDPLHSHSHLQHSPSLRDNIFSRQIYRPQQQVAHHNNSPPVATRQNNNVNNDNNNVSMRALKFSIDNILKPDFGRQTTPIYNIPNLKKTSNVGTLLSVRSSNGLGLHDVGRTSTSKRNSVGTSGNGKHGVSADKVGLKNRNNGGALPMDLSKVVSPVSSSADGRDTSSASEGSAAAAISPAASATGMSASGTLPGSPQLLWPAWVYCTRYSDRPSS
ncbi:hypothetical protein Cfor_12988, partial [Coptotermes formosanus]